MNAAIRRVIEDEYQTWRSSPAQSLYGGTIGAADALPFDPDAAAFFTRRGIPILGRFVEDLIEADFLEQVTKIASWLPDTDRRSFDQTVAFGLSATGEPNALARACLDGYAILFDDSFRTLLARAIEISLAYLVPPRTVTDESFPLVVNTAIAFHFFHAVDPMVYMANSPEPSHEQKQLASHSLWFISNFFLAHEAGHILLQHFANAPQRNAIFNSSPTQTVEVLRPAQDDELAADAFAIDLLFEGEQLGGLVKPGFDRITYWNSSYADLGWIFAILEAIELLSARMGFEIADTHPPACLRWTNLAGSIRNRVSITSETVEIEQKMRTGLTNSARHGDLPILPSELRQSGRRFVQVPDWIVRTLHDDLQKQWVEPTDAFRKWIECTSTGEAKQILREHPELLHPKVAAMHTRAAIDQEEEAARYHILLKRLLLWRRCLDAGIDATFEELSHGPLGLHPDVTVTAELNSDKSKRLQSVVASAAGQPIEQVLERFDRADLAHLEGPVNVLIMARTGEEIENVINNHPELITHPGADVLLVQRAIQHDNEEAKLNIELIRSILVRCRQVSVCRAVLEHRAKIGF